MSADSEAQLDDDSPEAKLAWLRLSEGAFASDWDNDLDAIYDNWRQLYGVEEGHDNSS